MAVNQRPKKASYDILSSYINSTVPSIDSKYFMYDVSFNAEHNLKIAMHKFCFLYLISAAR